MLIAGLIGDPVEHSLSPFMHNAAFSVVGLDARYELWQTPEDEIPARLESLRRPGILGANVTVPHKQVVMPLLDSLSDTAARIGAVNTIIPQDGRLHGDNTDAYGFRRSLAEAGEGVVPTCAVVVGAGGASRAVLVSLQELEVDRIVLINRTVARAEALAEELNGPGRSQITPLDWDRLDAVAAEAGVIVNATSVGWHGDDLPFAPGIVEALPAEAIVFDLTYRATALLRRAAARGLRAVDGLPMLIHQGARSFELWTGKEAPVTVMTDAVAAEQARRS